ncbi:hypothetical protein NDU88_000310 [Pleurodeles waltl]|uniref:Uncharacterized protein n=1 Tax=Pleurodeles waltl TaxID=8319 RepID=A0AAV7P0G9_PLEWA|nr:hypothetical protein NDU88_000310 [Pleurodeles waltl]
MWTLALCCAGLLLLQPAAAQEDSSDMQFVLMAPALLKSKTSEMLCVFIRNIETPAPVTVVLDHASFSLSVLNETVPAGSPYFKCAQVYIPPTEKADLAYVSITAGKLKERKSVVVNSVRNVCVLEKDKPFYKAGETVRFRILCLNGTLLPTQETLSLVEVRDPSGNRLMQQRNVETNNSYASFTYKITDEPKLGFYQIQSETESGASIYESFEVREYVLPTHSVTLQAPQSASILEESLPLGISASYTYGQPLVGNVKVTASRKPNSWRPEQTCSLAADGIHEVIEGVLGPDGVLNMTISLQKFQFYRPGLENSLSIEATVTENGTDIQVTETKSVWFSQEVMRLNFDYSSMDRYYKRGINYSGSLILQGVNSEPIPNEGIDLYIDYSKVDNCTTDEDGKCFFSIDTTNFVDATIVIEARYPKSQECSSSDWTRSRFSPTEYRVNRFYSKSGSFLKLSQVVAKQNCGQATNMDAEFILNREALDKDATSITFYYVIMSQAKITQSGQVDVPIKNDTRGSFSFPFLPDFKTSPVAHLLVFTVMKTGEIVADRVRIDVENCFQNKVNLTFSAAKGRPGSSVNLRLQAAPGSHCGIRAVDQSVLLMNGGRDQSLGEKVLNQLPYRELYGYYQEGFNLKAPEQNCVTMKNIIHEGVPYMSLDVGNDGSVSDIFEDMGMQLLSAVDPRKPNVCPTPNYCPEPTPLPIQRPGGGIRNGNMLKVGMDGAGRGFSSAVIESVRTFFPEVWFFTDAVIGSDGSVEMPLTLPDTITEWKADGFCSSETQGFGATKVPASVTSFQDFFSEMTIPFSIIRKESFILKVLALNYLPQCVKVKMTLAESPDYTAEPLHTEAKGCVCQNERTTYSWDFQAKKLGYMNISASAETIDDSSCNAGAGPRYKDTLTKQLPVEPEGIEREESQSSLVCTKDGPLSEIIDLKLPPNLVEDSARAHITCLGDPIGLSMQNLNNLVQMPSGCAEHNIAKMESNLVAYYYLNATNSLTPEKEAEIKNNLNVGYARQLTFYNSAGFFTTWARDQGNWNLPSNIWLTARCYTCFAKTKDIIFIDETILRQVESWLAQQQNKTTGAFHSDGRGYNNLVNDDASFTAYIASAFLNAGNSVSHPVVHDGLNYLNSIVETSDDTHAQAQMCYFYAVVRDEAKHNLLLGKLDGKAVKEGNAVYLKGPEVPIFRDFSSFRRRARSYDIYMTSNYLLCHLMRKDLSAKDLTHAAGVGQWLGRQMNPNGGFVSSADTPTAFEALSKFQLLTYAPNGTNTVNLNSGGTQLQQFQVTKDNQVLLQRATLPTVPGVYSANVSGTGCVYLQTTLRYNIKFANIKTSFDIKAWTSPATCVEGAQAKFDLHINISYTGSRNSSNIAIVDVKLPSGHRSDDASLRELKDQRVIPRFETSPPGHVVFYFDTISSKVTSFSFRVEQTTKVNNVQKSRIIGYDYYEIDEFGYAEYSTPCSKSSSPDPITLPPPKAKTVTKAARKSSAPGTTG